MRRPHQCRRQHREAEEDRGARLGGEREHDRHDQADHEQDHGTAHAGSDLEVATASETTSPRRQRARPASRTAVGPLPGRAPETPGDRVGRGCPVPLVSGW
ncbi:hypothetical protein GCM10027212_20150 [Actinotalea caeni]